MFIFQFYDDVMLKNKHLFSFNTKGNISMPSRIATLSIPYFETQDILTFSAIFGVNLHDT